MHRHAQLIDRFYRAFARQDADDMVECYHPDVVFHDPVFGELNGEHARAMWRMLCARAKDLRIEHSGVDADDAQGRAHWEAYYTFTGTGRAVHNVIDAVFRFADGKIVRHDDSFDLWRWSGMALGPVGKLLGWLPPLQRSIQRKALAGLAAWEARTG